jgi:hypothetical protein
MESLGPILLLLLVLFGVPWLVGKLKDAGVKQLSQKVLFRGTHQRGQAATRTKLTFTSDRSPDEVREAMRTGLGLPMGIQSTVLGRLYIRELKDREIVFASGSKLGHSFLSQLTLADRPDGGSSGEYEVLAWKHSQGIVSDVEQMTIVERKVRTVLEGLGAQVVTGVPSV